MHYALSLTVSLCLGWLAIGSAARAEAIKECGTGTPVILADSKTREKKEGKNRAELSGVVLLGDRLLAVSNEGVDKKERRHVLQVFQRDSETHYTHKSDQLLAEAPRTARCNQADFEAITLHGDRLIAIASHNANYPKNPVKAKTYKKLIKRLSRKIETECPIRSKLWSFKVSADGTLNDKKSGSLRTYINGHAILKRYAALPSKENGVDIEGLTATPLGLFIGFRGPVLRGNFTPILRVNHDMSLAGGAAQLLFAKLGGRGIRDLTSIGARIYILAGPNGTEDQTYRIYTWRGDELPDAETGAAALDVQPVCDLKPLERENSLESGPPANPEGIAVLSSKPSGDGTQHASRLLVVYDATSLTADIRTLPE